MSEDKPDGERAGVDPRVAIAYETTQGRCFLDTVDAIEWPADPPRTVEELVDTFIDKLVAACHADIAPIRWLARQMIGRIAVLTVQSLIVAYGPMATLMLQTFLATMGTGLSPAALRAIQVFISLLMTNQAKLHPVIVAK